MTPKFFAQIGLITSLVFVFSQPLAFAAQSGSIQKADRSDLLTCDLVQIKDDSVTITPRGEHPAKSDVLELFQFLKELHSRYAPKTQRDYVFDPIVLQQIANMGAGLPINERWQVILNELSDRYPGEIATNYQWTFNHAGNVTAHIMIVGGTFSEYVALFGTFVEKSGFSGWYPLSTVFDCMVDGVMEVEIKGNLDSGKLTYHGGETAIVQAGQAKAFKYCDGGAWMIDYSRGNIISMMEYGIMQPLEITQDYQSAWDQLVQYGLLLLDDILIPATKR